MAAHGWGTNRPLTELLFKKGYLFDFYQAVRILEVLNPEKTPVGEGSEPQKEVVRFKSKVDIEFPASDVSEIIPPDTDQLPERDRGSMGHGDQSEMIINFMGLAGCLGPLPASYTELIIERTWRKDTAFQDFLDIFNHRLASIIYRVRKTYRIGFDFKSPEESHFARYLFSLFGLGTDGLKRRMTVKDRGLLFYAALLAQQPRSMYGLESILHDYFKVKIKGNQFCGQWYHIDKDQVTRIGISGNNQILGKSALLGTRVWNQQGKFELYIGPLSFEEFLDFLPVGPSFLPLYQLSRFYVGIEFDFDFLLILRGGEVSESRLGDPEGPRLGWTSWLKTREFKAKYGKVRLSPRFLGPDYYPSHISRVMRIDKEEVSL